MDFFARQHLAKRNTRKFVILFCLVILAISALNHLVFSMVAGGVAGFNANGWHEGSRIGMFGFILNYFFDLKYALAITFFTMLIIMLLAFYKYCQLRDGGKAVAELMGGRELNVATDDFHERKLMNVVEEMAIASGVPMPGVFIFDRQRGINAFAAGYTVDDCVIGVTEGCVRLLNRDELQGVIAHEFSHILNQDMRLNLRLVVFVHGLLSIAILGKSISDIADEEARYLRGEDGGSPAVFAQLIGMIIYLFGSLGAHLSALVKCAVSREREYLADASAIQFTRNPEGFAGALKKIAAWDNGSRVAGAHASELSHMFFGSGLPDEEGSLGDTHPPIQKRIKLIEPYYDGDLSNVSFPHYPKYVAPAKDAHLQGATVLWVESDGSVVEYIKERLSSVTDLRLIVTDDLGEVRSVLSSNSLDYVVVNTGAVEWFKENNASGFGVAPETTFFVFASDAAVKNALDALENSERDVVEKPVSVDNLPFQLQPLSRSFDFHFMGWYGVYLCRVRGQQAASSSVPIEPVSSVFDQAGIPEVVGVAAVQGCGVGYQTGCVVSDLVGAPRPEHVDFAVQMLRSLPDSIRSSIHDTHDACALVFGLLLDAEQGAVRLAQLRIVADHFGDHMETITARLSGDIEKMDARAKLPVADLAIGALRQLSDMQYVSFKYVIEELAHADQAMDLFEYSLSKLIIRHLDPHFGDSKPSVVHIYSLKNMGRECSVLISALANVAGGSEESVRDAFNAGKEAIEGRVNIDYLNPSSSSLVELDDVLVRLNTLEARLKKYVVNAAAAAVAADGHLQRQEAELLRAICDGVGCPIPPLAISFEEAA